MAVNGSGLLVSGLSLGGLTIDASTTVAAFSEAILTSNYGWQEGDQLTFFHGVQSVDTVTGIPRATITGYRVVMNTADETLLWSLVSPMGYSSVSGSTFQVLGNVLGTSQAIQSGAGVWVHSRETDSGLKVSTQFFYVENAALVTYQSSAAQTASANSYGGVNTGEVFLQPSAGMVSGFKFQVSSNVNENVNENENTGGGSGTSETPETPGTGGNTGGGSGSGSGSSSGSESESGSGSGGSQSGGGGSMGGGE